MSAGENIDREVDIEFNIVLTAAYIEYSFNQRSCSFGEGNANKEGDRQTCGYLPCIRFGEFFRRQERSTSL